MASDDQGAFGFGDQAGSVVQSFLGLLAQFRHLERSDRREVGLDHFQLYVAGNVNQHRAWASLLSDHKGLANGGSQVFGRHHHEALLGAGGGDGADVALLKRLGAESGARHLSGDSDQRHRVGLGAHDAGDEVGRSGAGGSDTDAHLATDPRVSVGGMGRGLLVAHEDVAELRIAPKGVVER